MGRRKKHIEQVSVYGGEHSQAKLMIMPDTWYGITLNPATQFAKCDEDRFILAYATALTHLKKLRIVTDYVLYPEFSPAKSCGMGKKNNFFPRLHFHGLVKIDPIRFYNGRQKSILVNFMYELADITDKEQYLAYSRKNDTIMKMFCDHYHVPYEVTPSSVDTYAKHVRGWYSRAHSEMSKA